jgi:hypothetical protein
MAVGRRIEPIRMFLTRLLLHASPVCVYCAKVNPLPAKTVDFIDFLDASLRARD